MARHLARLKLSLLASAFRRGWQQALGLVVGAVMGVPVALGVFVLLWVTGRQTTFGDAVVMVVFAVAALLWTGGPVLAFGVDETLDAVRLRLLPLTRRQLVGGMLAASAVGVGPAVTLIALSGAVLGHAPVGPAAIVVVLAVAAQFLLCLLLARSVTAALSNRLRSRRGKGVTAMLAGLAGLGFALMAQIPNAVDLAADNEAQAVAVFERVAEVVGWLPIAWPARAVVTAGEGQLLAGIGWLLATSLLLVGLGRWWAASLDRSLTTTEAAPHDAEDHHLFPRLLTILPCNRFGATVAKELRYAWRLPQLRVQWLGLVMLSLGVVVAVVLVDALRRPEAVLVPALLGGLQGATALNAFGGDRSAIWSLVAAGGIQPVDLAGKNAAMALIVLPTVTAVSVALAAVTGGWSYVPLAAVAAVGLLALVLAVGNVASAVAPQPLSDSPTNLFAGSGGVGCTTFLIQMAAMAVMSLMSLPAVGGLVAALVWRPSLVPVVAVLAAAYGLACWWGGLRIGGRLVRNRGPEILSALSGAHT